MGGRERRMVQELLRDLHLEEDPEATVYLAVVLVFLVAFVCAIVAVLALM